MKDFSKDILHTIETEQIAPRPRWVFVVRQTAFFAGFLLSVLIGGISVSVILFALTDIGPGMGRMMRMHPGPFLVTYLPYAWVFAIVAFGLVAYYDLRNIKGAYRYRATAILGVSVLLSIGVGVVLHAAGMGKAAERRVAQMMPRYQTLDARKMHFWGRPQGGMLAGTIVSVMSTSTVLLEDFSGNPWLITVGNVRIQGPVAVVAGERVRVAGTLQSPGVFSASDIFPWEQRGMMHDPTRSGEPMRGDANGAMLMRERNPLRNP